MSRARVLRPTRFTWPLLLYLGSAVGGLWIAHGTPDAWLTVGMIVVSLALYGLLVRFPACLSIRDGGEIAPLDVFFGLLPTAISLYFLLTSDWSLGFGKLPWLNAAMRWFSTFTIRSGNVLNPNTAGGLIAVFLPLQIFALWTHRHQKAYRWAGALALAISLLGLLMSASRGAWLGLGLTLVGWGLWLGSGRLARARGAGQRVAVVLWLSTIAILGTGTLLFLSSPRGNSVRAFIESDRAVIWRNSLDLVTDYPFIGLGLGRFEMAYSSYTLLLHVGHTLYAHDLFLDVWLEQGLPGVIALGWLVVLAVWPQPAASPWRGAALASLSILLLHGIVDDVFYGLGRAVVLVIPLALLARSAPRTAGARFVSAAGWFAAATVGTLAILTTALVGVPRLRAAFLANLGTVAQSRVELTSYRWPEWPIQDELRRSTQVELKPAVQFYEAALALDPDNVTANRRLGQIELSLGQYEAACGHVLDAYRVAPWQRATRQMAGECYAIVGDTQRAAQLWRTVDVSSQQLALRQWWYEHLGDQQRANWVRQAAALSE